MRLILPYLSLLLFATLAAAEFPLPPDSRTDFTFAFGANKAIEFRTAPNPDRVSLQNLPDGRLLCRIIEGKQTSDTYFNLNGVAKRNFGWNDTLLGWSSVYEKRFAKDPATFRHTLTFENADAKTVLFLNGTAVAVLSQPVSAVRTPEHGVVTGKAAEPLPPSPYRTLDIAARFNAAGTLQLPEPGLRTVGGVPFRLAGGEGFDHIDLAASWFREGMLTGYEEPHTGSFGGRWTGAAGNDPTRFQFRVPNEEYDTLWLLAGFDGRENHIARLTAQFFRARAGAPIEFPSGDVPALTDAGPFQTTDANGEIRYLHRIKIPLSQARLKAFSDAALLDFELTKDVQTYIAWPDAFYYSRHAAGLPSGVRIYAATLERAALKIDFSPDAYANIWTAPEAAAYTVRLTNRGKAAALRQVNLVIASFDGEDKRTLSQSVAIQPGKTEEIKFRFSPLRFGHYEVMLETDGGEAPWQRTMAYLRPRPQQNRPFEAPGFHFGFWNWGGEHRTPDGADIFRIAGALGMESLGTGVHGHKWATADAVKLMERYGIRTNFAFGSSDLWVVSYLAKLSGDDEKDFAKIRDSYRSRREAPSSVADPKIVRIFAEPSGIGTHGVLPEFYGEPETPFSAAQQKVFDSHRRRLLLAARALKELAPEVKLLMPHGDPVFAVPFLKQNDEASRSFDGIAVDIGYFERLPEQQMHQCSIHRMYMVNTYWKKFRKTPPLYVSVEGPCIAPVLPGALTGRENAAHMMRASLLLGAYGVSRQYALASLTDSGDYWGEQHYGGGLIGSLPLLNPHPAFSAAGTLIRHMRDLEFIDAQPTGSLSTYSLRFRNLKDGGTVYVMWVIRGRREAMFDRPVRWFDAMDNERMADRVVLSDLPVFVYGGEPVAFGAPDHSDAVPAAERLSLGNAAELFVRQTAEADPEYLDSFPEAIRRFPAHMSLDTVAAPAAQGGKALAITLPEQPKDRGVMPFFTTLRPERGIVIPGKASSLSLWVNARSDWGRIVYVLRDAKGEKWISCGSKGEWNSDDMRNLSYFNFDGWRLLRFPLPANAPYDHFREGSSQSWGCSEGDGIVDLPLSLEKVFLERRPQAMYVNSLEKTSSAPVELGELYAEYADKFDKTPAALALSRVAMPPPPLESQSNPLDELRRNGTLQATEILEFRSPESAADGTRANVFFKAVPDAVSYDIYIGQTPDGAGAIRLGRKLKQSGALIHGFRAQTEFYAFIVWHDKQNRHSVPSAPFRFRMENQFGMR